MISAVKMLTFDEGLKYRAYKDTTGHKTVGVGFNMDSPSAKRLWIKSDIIESFNLVYNTNYPLSTNSIGSLLNTCIDDARFDLESIFEEYDSFPEGVKLALINMMFNMGKTTFIQFHDTINLIEDGKYDEVATHIMDTKWAMQVHKRANRVAALFRGDDSLYKVA